MVNLKESRAFAEDWVDAWNRHDLDAIVSHYADPPEHSSPLIVERLGRADGTIRSAEELRAYFQRGLEGAPPLRFELLDVFPGVSSVAVLYRNHRGKTVLEVMYLDAQNKVTRSTVHYR
jgi:hypothetical protein